MKLSADVEKACKLSQRYRIDDGHKFKLADHDPADLHEFSRNDKKKAKAMLREGVDALSELQDRLYAQNRWSVLLIFQALDAAGKDSAIKHVMSGVNPQGCQVFSFKAPSAEELDHTYLWRCMRRLPERGRIGIFNRSYYEEVLVVRVHPELLAAQRLPKQVITDDIWKDRFDDIAGFERYLARNGVAIRKFFLNVSKEEQKKRFLRRLDRPDKHWKFSEADVREREHWDEYQHAYEQMIRHTASKEAPWYVVPADRKWYTRIIVASAVVDALQSLDLHYPVVPESKQAELAAARKALGDGK